jgi:predicted DsbA family dithiol-disulfide isomerase
VRTDRIVETFDVQLRITQFPLHPDTPPEGQALTDLFAGRDVDLDAYQDRVVKIAAQEGLPYGLRTHTYNSRLAQELARWAEEQPGGETIHDALFRAYFVDGINLAEIDRLAQIAGSVGLSEEEALRVLEDRTYRGKVDEDWDRSAQLGVTGVPTFFFGNRGVVGAQPYEALEELVVRGGAQRRK